jgi:hypothetical protein
VSTLKLRITQVTFLPGEALLAGTPVDDQTKLVIAAAPDRVALEVAFALTLEMEVTIEPPDGAIRSILEQP